MLSLTANSRAEESALGLRPPDSGRPLRFPFGVSLDSVAYALQTSVYHERLSKTVSSMSRLNIGFP
jgi:hypothetical protein